MKISNKNLNFKSINDSEYLEKSNFSIETKNKRRKKFYDIISKNYPNAKIVHKHEYAKLANEYNAGQLELADFLENVLGDIFKPVVYLYVNHNLDFLPFEDALSVAYLSARDFMVKNEFFLPEKKSEFVFLFYAVIYQGIVRYYKKSLRGNVHLAFNWEDVNNVIDVEYFTSDSDNKIFQEDILKFIKMTYKTKFTPNQQNVFDMSFICEMSGTEIAKILGISRNRVNQLKNRVVTKLTKGLNNPNNFEIVK